MKLLSVHIPETAGGLFGELLMTQFAEAVCLHYYHPYDANWNRLSDIPAQTRYLHGHFPAGQFRERYERAMLVTWLRDPAERVAAEYDRLKREPDPQSELSQLIANGATLLDFAEHPFARNAQVRYVDSVPLQEFTFLGISENFLRDLARFCTATEIVLPSPRKRLPRISLSDEAREHLLTLNREDAELYQRASERTRHFVDGEKQPGGAEADKNSPSRAAEMVEMNYFDRYLRHLAKLKGVMNESRAFEAAVGGDFATVGKLELAVLKKFGFHGASNVVDVGCGSGRLAAQLAAFPAVSYLGTDVVPDLLDYARKLVKRADWRFVATDGIQIPDTDNSADFITFFSVFTHLTHEDCYRYLKEAKRVLRPGGKILVSFLEFRIPSHWEIFRQSLEHRRKGDPMNIFMDRDGLNAWVNDLGLELMEIVDGDKPEIPIEEEIVWESGRKVSGATNLGQSLAVLTKR
jgi:SAM-dependent methyltransferase